jgi:GTP-binding protein
VGKSRFFNRLIGDEKAIVHDLEGVTRDRQYGTGEWYGRDYAVVDTGGFVLDADEPMLEQMRQQAQLAIEEADAIIMLMDGRQGLLPQDREIVDLLRRADKPVYYAVNKIDTYDVQAELLDDFWQLGVDLFPTSAEHGLGMDDLMDDLAEWIPRRPEPGEGAEEGLHARVAVVGKPNVGKSTLVNQLLGSERLLTSDVAGTTRDSIDTRIVREGREYLFIDTAGLRKKRKVSEQLEYYSVFQALRSIDRADVVLLVVDAVEGISAQVKKIASVIVNHGRGCVVLLNKWDAIPVRETDTAAEYAEIVHREIPFLDFAPVLTISALTGTRVERIFELIDEIYVEHGRRVPTSQVNKMLERVLVQHSPPLYKSRPVKFYYASQVATRPPTFACIVNYPEAVAPSYERYLENQIREEFGFVGTPIRLLIKKRRRRE